MSPELQQDLQEKLGAQLLALADASIRAWAHLRWNGQVLELWPLNRGVPYGAPYRVDFAVMQAGLAHAVGDLTRPAPNGFAQSHREALMWALWAGDAYPAVSSRCADEVAQLGLFGEVHY